MSIFVMGDLHLSTNQNTNKSMEIFGKRWQNYMQRIKDNWEELPDDFICPICKHPKADFEKIVR